MEFWTVLAIIVAVILVGLLAVYLHRKGYFSKEGFDIVNLALEIANIVNSVTANNKIVDIIIESTQLAVHYVEQVATTANNETKKKMAIETTYKALELAGVEITEQVKQIVEVSIESAVNMLPSTYNGLKEI